MMWKKRKHAATPKGSDLTAFIDEGSEIEGKYTFRGTVMMHANVRAGIVFINGEVVGNVVASERVELRGSARVFGDVEAPVVVVEEGVFFEGNCKMTKMQGADGPPVARPEPLDRPASRHLTNARQ